MATMTFATWRALTELLSWQAWPSWPGASRVGVWLGDPFTPPADLAATDVSVVVVPIIDSPDQDWAALGAHAKNESFRVPVVASVLTPGLTALEVACRLESLAEVIESVLREAATVEGRPAGLADHVWQIGVAQVRPAVWPSGEGYVGQVEIPVGINARI